MCKEGFYVPWLGSSNFGLVNGVGGSTPHKAHVGKSHHLLGIVHCIL